MLLRLSANRDEFQPIVFKPGFNAIVAEESPDSTNQDSRNARGKSSLLRLLNYVLAGNLHPSLRPLAEAGWEMTLSLQMFGGTVTATRALQSGRKLKISAEGSAVDVLQPWLSDGQIRVEDWKAVLGLALFHLEPTVQELTGAISVRTLLSYVIRTDTPRDPLKVMPQQSAASSREHVAFLLGLDWQINYDLAKIDVGLNQIKAISSATREGLVASLRPEGDLVLERAAVKNEIEEWEQRIAGFKILENPNSLVMRADQLTSEITRLRDDAVVDRRMRELYAASLAEELDSVGELPVEQLFDQSGAILAEGFKRQIDEVREFHRALLENRRAFLRSEMAMLDKRIVERAAELEKLDAQRDSVLRTLDAGGVLEELGSMRAELSEAQVRMAALDAQIEQSREIATRREELKLEQSTRRNEANHALADSRRKLDRIADRFSQKMALVNHPGFRAHLLLWEGWHDAKQVRPGDQGQSGPAGSGASRRVRHRVGGDEGHLHAVGDECRNAA